ncbi:hypothetical protein NDU88_005969 [Pleurodeles waltl]|uniref:Uncharacterized protein n=1 Tax=Pleurodeles waltl TaxID=8319 RepID=A0AAV7LPD2_PLEWA|nr:hypothetical protein NDU88_005969 [Pleurodeles waltl]
MVMGVVDEDVVHAGVSGDTTGRVVDKEEEGDTVEAVDVGDSGYPHLSWLMIPVRNPRTGAENRRHVPYLQEKGGDNAAVAAVDTEDSEEEEEEEDVDNMSHLILQYFQ